LFENIVWTAAAAAIGWLTETLLHWLLKMWRRRHEPLSADQLRRFYRRRFALALFIFAWMFATLLICAAGLYYATEPRPLDYAATTCVAIATVHLARIARRRWRRLHENSPR
jgi:hypothetical protein